MNKDQLLEYLRSECRRAGSQKAWAEKNGLSNTYVSDVLAERRGIGKSILDALGYREPEKLYTTRKTE